MKIFNLSPLTKKKIKSFKAIKRGYWSFLILLFLIFLSLIGELLINSKALLVKYEGEYYFPTYSRVYQGKEFNQEEVYGEANYRKLKQTFEQEKSDNYVIMPLIPYNEYEQDFSDSESYPPTAPSIEDRHYLGTDTNGRDIVARLLYGFRYAIGFALLTMIISYAIGVAVGCSMGFFGGTFDILMQRVIEIWSMVPFLYVIMILVSIVQPTFFWFVAINVLFGWLSITFYMRTMTYKESTRDYVRAAKVLGASTPRIIFNHILPNTMVMIVTLAPFTIAGNITALTALDYLGLGLQPPTPSWGELLQQGKSNLGKPWIVASVVSSLVLVLIMVTFIGESVRAAFDPKKFTRYD